MSGAHGMSGLASRAMHQVIRATRAHRRIVLALAVAASCGLLGSVGPLRSEGAGWASAFGIEDAAARGRGGGGMRGGGGFSRGGMSRPSGGSFQRSRSQGNLRYGGAGRDFSGASSRSFDRSGQRNYGGYGGGSYGGRTMNRDYGAMARDRGTGSVSARDQVAGSRPAGSVSTRPAGGRELGQRAEGGVGASTRDKATRPTQGQVSDRMQGRGDVGERQGQRQEGHEQRQADRADRKSQRQTERSDRQSQRQDTREQRQTERTDRVTERQDQRTQRREDWQNFRTQTQEQRQDWIDDNWDEIEDIYDDHGWWGHYDCYGCMWGMTGLYYGMYLASIPTYYQVVYVGGETYRYYDGVYYTAAPTSGYVVTPAPVGAELSRPPPECYVLSVDAMPYCYYQGAFYVYDETGKYSVVKAPVGAVVPYVPSTTPPKSAAGTAASGTATAASAPPAKPAGPVEFNGVTYEPVYDGSELAYKVVAS